MDVTKDRVLNILYESIDDLNEQLDDEHRMQKHPETSLLGDSTRLDSLGFVNFIVLVEDRCERSFGMSLSLTETGRLERADPFETIGTLADFITGLLNGHKPVNN